MKKKINQLIKMRSFIISVILLMIIPVFIVTVFPYYNFVVLTLYSPGILIGIVCLIYSVFKLD